MSKIKMLLDVVESMRSLADSIEVLAQGIADGQNRPKTETKPKLDKPVVTHEMLRELAVKLSRGGRKDDVKALLDNYGVKNITAVAENDLESFYTDLLSLDGDANASCYGNMSRWVIYYGKQYCNDKY